jgi:hypothetical protein
MEETMPAKILIPVATAAVLSTSAIGQAAFTAGDAGKPALFSKQSGRDAAAADAIGAMTRKPQSLLLAAVRVPS